MKRKGKLLAISLVLIVLIAAIIVSVESAQIHKAVHLNMRNDLRSLSNSVIAMDEMLSEDEAYDEDLFRQLSRRAYETSHNIYLISRSDPLYKKYKCSKVDMLFIYLSSKDASEDEVMKYKDAMKYLAEKLNFRELSETDTFAYDFLLNGEDIAERIREADEYCDKILEEQ